MISIAISVLWLLIGLIVLVGMCWVVVWALGEVGIVVPPKVVRLIMVVLGLLVLIYFLSLLVGGPGLHGRILG